MLKRSLRAGAVVLATVNLLGLGLAQPAAAHTEVSDTATTSELFGGGTTAPTRDTPVPISGFRDDTVITGLTLPTTIKFAPNGDIFVAEKSGLIKRYTSLTDTSPDLVVNLQTEVYNYFDRGLLGLAVDRQYPARPYLYALYSRDAPLGQSAPYWDAPNTASDGCLGPPNGPGNSTDGCVTSGRLIRITVGTNGQATATKTLVDGWCGQFTSHSIGTVLMGPDGYLYAGGGDGASFSASNLDYGQLGGTVINPNTSQPYTPRNPCGDPPGGVGGAMTLPTAEGGAMRTQDKRTPGDPTGLNGTIIRVDPDTGVAAPTNPSYTTGVDDNDKRIIAYGLRNPYRFTFRPGTNELWIGDVGAESWEEVDRIVSPTKPVRNFGWPCYEGNGHEGNWDALNTNLCENLYAAGASAVQGPYATYYHLSTLSASDPCPAAGGVISGVAFYTGTAYPSRFKNSLFFTDYGRQCIWSMKVGTNGLPDPSNVETVDQIADGPVDLIAGPNGDIFYIDHLGGTVHRLVYKSGNQPPTIVATATPNNGPAPLLVHFDTAGTKDPEGNAITYAWDLDGDGQFDDATGATAQKSYSAGTWLPAVKATDSLGASSTQGFQIFSGNSAPVPVIDTPSASLHWKAGQSVAFSGHATDPDDGALPAASLSWRVILHHCTGPLPTDCHEHIIQDFNGESADSFVAPDHDLPAHLELRLTATDSNGLTSTVSLNLDPQTVALTFDSTPPGIVLKAGTTTHAAPFSKSFIVDGQVTVIAPPDQLVNGNYYAWTNWSDSGTKTHTIKVPSVPTTYTANYTGGTPADAANTCESLVSTSNRGQWYFNTLSSTSDVDWYRFSYPSAAYALATLGGLASNLRLDLYSACGTAPIASSDNAGTRFEEIYSQLPIGTYYLRVSYSSGTLNAGAPYGVRFSLLSDQVQVLSASSYLNSAGKQVVVGEVLNNTGDVKKQIQLEVTYYNAADVVLKTVTTTTFVDIMGMRTRSPFSVSVTKPAGYDHFGVVVSFSQRTSTSAYVTVSRTSLNVTSVPGPQFSGGFKNTNAFGIHAVNSIVTLYDNWAVVMNARSDPTSPTSLSANATGTFSSTFKGHYTGWSNATVIIEATKN